MKKINLKKAFLVLVLIGYLGFSLSSCEKKSSKRMIVISETTADLQNRNYLTGDHWSYVPNSRLVLLDCDHPDKKVKVLTKDFYSACSPDISYDGRSVLFTGQKKQTDPWQIWEMNLENLKVKQITSSDNNCTDPAYLPGGRLVYSRYLKNDTVKEGYTLFTSNLNGSDIGQITFNPHSYFASTVLKDGRILTISRQNYPEQKQEVYIALRPDGTKQKLFYRGEKENRLNSRAHESKHGKVFFIEQDQNKGNIISVNYNRPLHSRTNISAGIEGDFYNVNILNDEKLLTVYRASAEEAYSLFEFDLQKRDLGQQLYKDKEYNVMEAVWVHPYKRPRNLPSELKMTVNSGIVVCQDINFTDDYSSMENSEDSKAVQIEILGINAPLGTVNVEKDGSFYLKMLADTPFRIQTRDQEGKLVNGPGSWIYLRPNERLGCVGCHENNEQVPFNRQPLAVRKDPVILPSQLNKIQIEKSH